MKIFVISDSPYLYTGLARVSKNVIRGLSDAGHEVVVGGWGWDQLAYPLNDKSQWVYRDDETGKEHIAFPLPKDSEKLLIFTYEVLKQIKCDAVFTIGDYWDFDGFHMLKQKLDYSFKWITYYTIESHPINEKYIPIFNYMDVIFSPSKYGKEVIERDTGNECVYAPYGVDHKCFYRLDEEYIQNQRKIRNLEGKFRFINVSKNQHRKNLPAFMEALKLANEVDDRIVGYMHTNSEKKVSKQIHLENLVKRFGIQDILSFPNKKLSIDIGYEDSDLNVEYNCSDALVVSSVAEGFCLPLLEAHACGLPIVGTNCSTIPELCLDSDIVVNSHKYFTSLEHEVRIIDVDKLAQSMVDISRCSCCVEKNINFAKGFSWEATNSIIADRLRNSCNRIKISVESI
jgi:glycosyltransferase involved in cell wall biosynthesis